ncbi:MAG: hypothetical protein IRY86_12365 [Thermorudis peleae]|nr:hypothetical protein [Thermorudis peleae]
MVTRTHLYTIVAQCWNRRIPVVAMVDEGEWIVFCGPRGSWARVACSAMQQLAPSTIAETIGTQIPERYVPGEKAEDVPIISPKTVSWWEFLRRQREREFEAGVSA